MSAFSLFLFTRDPGVAAGAVAAGVDGVVSDWENAGKRLRQQGADTQVNFDTADDLRRIRKATTATVLCRLNGFGSATRDELETAIDLGATEVLLPMVRSVDEVERVLGSAHDRCGVGILVETRSALGILPELGRMPLSRVFVGLNDLAIDRGSPSLFTAILDGTVERIRQHFHVPFGFGGLTLPELGSPVPCRLLIAEYARLDCQFSFLRRSYTRDIVGRDPAVEIPRIREAIVQATRRDEKQVRRDRRELTGCLQELTGAQTELGSSNAR